jgi:hypothetical protein
MSQRDLNILVHLYKLKRFEHTSTSIQTSHRLKELVFFQTFNLLELSVSEKLSCRNYRLRVFLYL